MPFRRQDLPFTTRISTEGSRRRIYPRFLRDAAMAPRLALAIDYLEQMVGRRRGDLSPDEMLEFLGEPRIARCLLACLGETYRPRSQTLVDVIGRERAATLAEWDISTSAGIRAAVYRNAKEVGGFADGEGRERLLVQVGDTLGLSGAEVGQMLHLDAERNQLLERMGPRVEPLDVIARFNVQLVMSVLRHASKVELDLPGLERLDIERLCASHGIALSTGNSHAWRLAGQKDALGVWSRHGSRLARSVVHLLMLPSRAPSGIATIHLGDRTLDLALDAKCVAAIRPSVRFASCAGATESLAETIKAANLANRGAGRWAFRRVMEPIVTADAVVLPEWTSSREGLTVALVGVDSPSTGSVEAVRRVQRLGPVLVVSLEPIDGVTTVLPGQATDLLEKLGDVGHDPSGDAAVREAVRLEVHLNGRIGVLELDRLLGPDEITRSRRLASISEWDDVVLIPGAGASSTALLARVRHETASGRIDLEALRERVCAEFGAGAESDAVTLHLLSQQPLTRWSGAEAA